MKIMVNTQGELVENVMWRKQNVFSDIGIVI